MVKLSNSLIERLRHRRSLRRWAEFAEKAPALPVDDLTVLRSRARQLRRHLDRVILEADQKIVTGNAEADVFRKPTGADWAWRPDPWRGLIGTRGVAGPANATRLAEAVSLHHDCPEGAITLRQLRNSQASDRAPYALRLEVLQFVGSFLSFVIDLPEAAAQGVRHGHMLRIDLLVEVEQPLGLFARLNLQQGPNVEHVASNLTMDSGALTVEFDLAYAKFDERRVDKLWVDLIFSDPRMNQITFRDLSVSRRPRARL